LVPCGPSIKGLLVSTRHDSMGDIASKSHNYEGKHQIWQVANGIGYFPLGDRDREKYEFGIEMVEERDSDPNIRRI
jgi:hypothetical protein